jgi:hypothetical protein
VLDLNVTILVTEARGNRQETLTVELNVYGPVEEPQTASTGESARSTKVGRLCRGGVDRPMPTRLGRASADLAPECSGYAQSLRRMRAELLGQRGVR